ELVTLVDAIREVYVKEFFEKDQLDRSERLTALEQMRDDYDRSFRARKKDQEELEKNGISRDALTRELRLRFEQQRLEWAERDIQQNAQDLKNENLQLSTVIEKMKSLSSGEAPDNLFDES